MIFFVVGFGAIFLFLLSSSGTVKLEDSATEIEETTYVGEVLYPQRMDGVVPELRETVLRWDGPFDILVAPDGGLRTDPAKQLQYFNEGNSKARTLAETPHGRGAAVDLWPMSFNPSRPLFTAAEDDKNKTDVSRFTIHQPIAFAHFEYMRAWATRHGLTILGRWDLPHWELPQWRSLPYPPKV